MCEAIEEGREAKQEDREATHQSLEAREERQEATEECLEADHQGQEATHEGREASHQGQVAKHKRLEAVNGIIKMSHYYNLNIPIIWLKDQKYPKFKPLNSIELLSTMPKINPK